MSCTVDADCGENCFDPNTGFPILMKNYVEIHEGNAYLDYDGTSIEASYVPVNNYKSNINGVYVSSFFPRNNEQYYEKLLKIDNTRRSRYSISVENSNKKFNERTKQRNANIRNTYNTNNSDNSTKYITQYGTELLENNKEQDLSGFRQEYRIQMKQGPRKRQQTVFIPSGYKSNQNRPIIKHLPNSNKNIVSKANNTKIQSKQKVESKLRLMSELFPDKEDDISKLQPEERKGNIRGNKKNDRRNYNRTTHGTFTPVKTNNGMYDISQYKENNVRQNVSSGRSNTNKQQMNKSKFLAKNDYY